MTTPTTFTGSKKVLLVMADNDRRVAAATTNKGNVYSISVGESDRFMLKKGESLELKTFQFSRPEDYPKIVWVKLWQEIDDSETDKSSEPERLRPDPTSSDPVRAVLYNGDVEVLLEEHSIKFTHLHDGNCEEARYQFAVRLKHRGKTCDWDPDVHDYGGSG